MNRKSLFNTGFLITLVLFVVSCSNDDHHGDPVGTVSVNMMNEDNGKTELGNSDVYIDNANNFYGPYCLIASLGKKSLGSISSPVLLGISNRVAVEQGNAYQIFKDAALREFPSGKIALNINADYYNVYVESQIIKDEEIAGAVVKFVLMDVPDNDLPVYNSNIGTLNHMDYENTEIIIELPVSDFERDLIIGNQNLIEHEKDGNKLKVRLVNFVVSDVFGFYIRIKDSYTYVYGEIK